MMFEEVFEELKLAARIKTGINTAVLAFGFIAIFAAVVALAFFCAAAYIGLAQALGDVQSMGALDACLILGGSFIGLCVIAAIAMAIARQRAVAKARARLRSHAWWADREVLTTVIEISRLLGLHKAIPLAVVGFLAANLTRNRGRSRRG